MSDSEHFEDFEEKKAKLIKSQNRKLIEGGKGKLKEKRSGRLPSDKEMYARAITNPANFAELVLKMDLSPKQRRALEMCAPPGAMVSIAACNGAGKTAFILPALVLWHASLWPAGKIKCTSGAFQQIQYQVWPAIQRYKEQFPNWKWLETPRFHSFDPDDKRKGFFVGFTTDEPGKAEGDHPEGTDCPLLFIVDEAKTCPVWLRGVLEGRVRPTRLVLMSSHGYSEGWFYESQRMMKDKFKTITISAEDCPWITKEEIEQVKKDFSGQPDFYNSVLGLDFMPLTSDAVINGRALDDNLANPPAPNMNGDRHAFCDFAWSGSGDQNVLALRRGNVITIEKKFQCAHLISSSKRPEPGIVEIFIGEFNRLGLGAGEISGDEGGGGRLVMDEFERLGWYLNRVNNGAPSTEPLKYASYGAEMWFKAGQSITNKIFCLPDSRTFRAQALSRKRVPSPTQKLAIETKERMKAERQIASPDEADAVFGCMTPGGGFTSGSISFAMAMQVGTYSGMSG